MRTGALSAPVCDVYGAISHQKLARPPAADLAALLYRVTPNCRALVTTYIDLQIVRDAIQSGLQALYFKQDSVMSSYVRCPLGGLPAKLITNVCSTRLCYLTSQQTDVNFTQLWTGSNCALLLADQRAAFLADHHTLLQIK